MRIILKNIKSVNSKSIIGLLTPNITKWLELIPYPPKLKDKRDWINKMKKEKTFSIFDKDNKKIVGLVWLENINKNKKMGEIGFLIGEKHQGNGYGKLAVIQILNYGFNKLKLKKIMALTNNYNKGSQGLLNSSGFKLDNVIKKDYKDKLNGKWCDVLIYDYYKSD